MGKPLPEEEPGAMDAGLDSGDGEPEGGRHFLVREAFDVVE